MSDDGDRPSRPGTAGVSLDAATDGETGTSAGDVGSRVVLRVSGRTDVGRVRDHNEDAFLIADLTGRGRPVMDVRHVLGERGALLGVCDGMGGAAAGEGASLQIWYEARRNRCYRGMGTTATVAALLDGRVFIGQVGDCRAYVLRGERLVQITRDQSLANHLIEAGQLTEEEAETFEYNNVILQALGNTEAVEVDLTYADLRRGDTLMLCSDGLSGMLRNEGIRRVLRANDDPREACRILTEMANEAGGHDNITVIVARVDGGVEEPTRDDVERLKYRRYGFPEAHGDSTPAAAPNARVDELELSEMPAPPDAMPEMDVDTCDADAELDDDGAFEDGDAPPTDAPPEEPIRIPTEGAPPWLLVLMITGAIAAMAIAACYELQR